MKKHPLIIINLTIVAFLFLSLASLSVKAADDATLKNQLTAVLGDKSSWKPKLFSQLKAGMSCEEVKKVFSSLSACDAAKDYDFPSASISDNPIVNKVRFTFNKGKLKGGKILFKSNIDKDMFKKVSLQLFEAKWGVVKPEKRDKDLLTKIGPGFVKAQRTFIGGIWGIDAGLPKTE